MSTQSLITTQTQSLAKKLEMEGVDPRELIDVMKATAFKGNVSDAQMTALLAVANQYKLNPWTKEIYAFPDKNNGIVPVVGVDGWSRIINSHPQFDGMEFEQDAESCTCIIYRKDRGHPVRVTEYNAECNRETGPWKSHPRRMLRHKAMIQCARLAFGFVGIYEQDEAERIVESQGIEARPAEAKPIEARPALAAYPAESFNEYMPKWRTAIENGSRTAEEIINFLSSKAVLSDEQKAAILALETTDAEYTDITEAAA